MWIVWLLVGFVFGVFAANIVIHEKSTAGVLKIDRFNPEKDLYRFEIDDLDSIAGKKHIVLKIEDYADLSQK
jgi:hypothetical protein|nr:MAG TPA: Protein of unknown function (DUF2897) [Herelleviridae sp.]